MARAMTAAEVAAELQYFVQRGRRAGQPNTDVVFRRAREASRDDPFPQPINPGAHPRLWRWARVQVEAYTDGVWPADEVAS